MRRGSILSVCLIVLSLLSVAPIFADRVTEDLQAIVVERFDSSTGDKDVETYGSRQNHRWIVRGSKFVTEGYPKFDLIKAYPDALFPRVPEGSDYRSLGVQAMFDRKGFNTLELIPVADKDNDQGIPVETPLSLPGRVKLMDLWFWGSNYQYYVEIVLRDFRGIVHTVPVGNINYTGWRNLRIEIPKGIPQDVNYIPGRRGLELVKIVISTDPTEKVVGDAPGGRMTPVKGDNTAVPFYIYVDHIKVLTDMFESPFDGSDLADPESVQKLWSSKTDSSAK